VLRAPFDGVSSAGLGPAEGLSGASCGVVEVCCERHRGGASTPSNDPSWMHSGGRFPARCDGHFASSRGLFWAPCEGGMRARSRCSRMTRRGARMPASDPSRLRSEGRFGGIASVISGARRGLWCAPPRLCSRGPLGCTDALRATRPGCVREVVGGFCGGRLGVCRGVLRGVVKGALRRRRGPEIARCNPSWLHPGTRFERVDEVAGRPSEASAREVSRLFWRLPESGIEGSRAPGSGPLMRSYLRPVRRARATTSRGL
jgi:hypothetical protein